MCWPTRARMPSPGRRPTVLRPTWKRSRCCRTPNPHRAAPDRDLRCVATPGVRSIADLCGFLDVTPQQCLKTLLVAGTETPAVALMLRGDHELNVHKAQQLDAVAAPLRMLSAAQVEAAAGVAPGSLGPLGLELPAYLDRSAEPLSDFVCGANRVEHHYTGVNWVRDLPLPPVVRSAQRNRRGSQPCRRPDR